jgi:hypothetical protein
MNQRRVEQRITFFASVQAGTSVWLIQLTEDKTGEFIREHLADAFRPKDFYTIVKITDDHQMRISEDARQWLAERLKEQPLES